MTEPPAQRPWSTWIRNTSLGWCWLLVPPLVAGALLSVTLRHHELNEPFFVRGTYYVLFALLAVYAGVQLTGELPSPRAWVKDNLPGILVSVLVSVVVVWAVAPGFRVLADEANLVGVSKNLFFRRTADFAVSGKWYFENYWALAQTTDRRPALFPFLVSLLHVARGYHVENAFHLNAIVFVLFVFSCYRLGKSLAGELFGVAAAVLVAAHPITLVEARSASFDLLATWLLVLVVKSFVDYARDRLPRQLAVFFLNLCLLAHVRYEGWALLAAAAVVLLALRMVGRAQLRGFGFLYSLLPLFLLPRWWQTIAKAHDAEQPLSASLFSFSHFSQFSREYLQLVLKPLEVGGPHAPLLIILGAGGCGLVAVGLVRDARARKLSPPVVRSMVFISVLLGIEIVMCFSYFWGKPLHAASARLFMWLDTTAAFLAAWLLTVIGRRWALPVTLLRRRTGVPVTLSACGVLFAMHLPAASEARFVNALIVTRDAAETWRFFEKLGDKRILILSDRPGLYTIMDYGALDISSANANRSPLLELSRHLYRDVYLIQEVDLNTQQPRPPFDAWPDVEKETVHEFQSTDSSSVRIARVKH
jgi:hypothetical protein